MARHRPISTRSLQAIMDWEDQFGTMVTLHDSDFNIVMANRTAERTLAIKSGTPVKCFGVYHGASAPPVGCLSCRCLKSGEPTTFEIFEPHLNSFFKFNALPQPGRSGGIQALIHVVRDISERKRMEEQILDSLRQKEQLLSEIRHRVGNNMQLINSLLELHAAHAHDPQVLDALRSCRDRIASMARVHERLYAGHDVREVRIAVYVNDLATALLQSFGAMDRIAIELDVTDQSMPLETAIPVGLILTELISNALKHAFPDGRTGTIWVGLQRAGDHRYQLVVRDDGKGLPAEFDRAKTSSLGLKLVTSFCEDDLHGKLMISAANGTCFKLDLQDKRSARPGQGQVELGPRVG